MGNKKFSYLLIKPDGIPKFKEIREEIQGRKLGKALYFKVENWEETQKSLYEKHYEKKKFATIYGEFIDVEKEIFGNTGIVIWLENDDDSEEFMKKVLELKQDIRNQYATEITIPSNTSEEYVDGKNYTIGYRGQVFRRFRFDLLHCPDPNEEITRFEIKKLIDLGIISEGNRLNRDRRKIVEDYDFSDNIKKYNELNNQDKEEEK